MYKILRHYIETDKYKQKSTVKHHFAAARHEAL